MNKDKNKKKKMAERFLAHALEIIYLLTGEEYTLVKKSSPHNCIHQLTGEFQIPIKCDDVAVYFSMEEWEYIEGHKERYKDVMMEDHQTLRDMETPKNEHSGLDGTNLNTAIISEEGEIESEDKSVLQVGTCLDLSPSVRDALLDTPVINQEGNHVSEEVSVSQVEICSDVCTDPMDSPEALAMTSSPASQSSPHQSLDVVDYRGVFCHGSLKVEDTDTYVGSRDVLEKSYTAVSSSSQIVEVNASLSEIRSQGEGTEINSAKELTFCESENLMSYSMAYQYEQHSQSPNESFGSYCNNVPYTTMSFKKFQTATSGKTSSRIIVCEDNLSSYTEENPINFGDNNYFKLNFMDAPLRVQTDNKLYVCQDCEKCFKKKSNFLAHRRTHTGEKPHVCQSCGKGFSQKCNLITHQRIHTGEKSYVCPQCKKGFTQRATLTKHQRTHTGEKPYICQKCGKGFNQKSFLLAHQITHAEGKS